MPPDFMCLAHSPSSPGSPAAIAPHTGSSGRPDAAQKSYFGAFAAILCSDRAEYMGGPLSRPEAWAEFANYTALWMLHGHGLWTIDCQFGPSCGFVLLGYEYDDPEAELGVFLTEEAEGQGFAQEAAEAVRSYAFDTLKWESVVSYVDASNTRCVALMERLGAFRDAQSEAALGRGTLVFRHVPAGGGA